MPAESDLDVSRCIFRNMGLFAALLTLCVLTVDFVPDARDRLQEKDLVYAGFILFILSFLVLIVSRALHPPRVWRAAAVVFFALGTVFLLTVSSASADPGAATLALTVSLLLFGTLSVIGLRSPLEAATIRQWSAPLLAILVGVILVMVVNLFADVAWVDVFISLVIVVLFSAYVVVDVSYFVTHCSGPSCCLDGTVNLWLDFANLFSAFLNLSR